MAFLFVHFTGEHENGEQVYFSLSRDGLHYEDVNEGKPVLVLKKGERGIRDPFIIRGVHGEGFFIIGTDLRMASHHDWGKAQFSGSRNLVVYHSRDLIHWSEPLLAEVGLPEAGCVWAPEAIYDEEKGAYMIFFASMVKEEGEEAPKQRIYTVYTKDFCQFTRAEKYIERENHVIDTTMIHHNGVYYRFSKDETTKRITCDCCEKLHGVFRPIHSELLENLEGVEGPAIFYMEEKQKWCLMVDQYASNGGYVPLLTEDLSSGVFKKLSPEEYDMGRNKKRHGSVLAITEEEYQEVKAMKTGSFEQRDDFYLNGEKFQIISGAIHYFRVVPEYWKDRLEKLKAMGCNTVETYIPWNMHEPKKGEFHFEGITDIKKFIETAQEIGLYVILRPSPYICAEWEFGGIPGWLLAEPGMRLRCSYEPFLQHVREYYDRLFEILTPLQIPYGGPVIMMQVENEYGYYGTDSAYMLALKNMMIERGVVVPLVTSDGARDESITCGQVEGALPTGNFGSHTQERFGALKRYTKGGPLMCTEFWVGWFDHWGNGGHMTGNLEESTKDLDEILQVGHVNIYMFEGGTNFGFMNGSNYYDELTPDVTSYDYDGILTEDGQITEKYRRYRNVISKYAPIPEVTFTTDIKRKAYGTLKVTDKVSLFSVLDDISTKVESVYPMSMERLGQNYGYILYRSVLEKERSLDSMKLWKANDRANILLDNRLIKTLYDKELLEEHEIKEEIGEHAVLDILMENMGRVNFGPHMDEQRKGIDGCVQINGRLHHNWEIYPLPLDQIEKVDFSKEYQQGTPAFYRFCFEAEELGDTFLDFEGWGKGCVFVNGFHIGRFWEIGPQKRLYIPAPLLKQGGNEIIIFETEGKATEHITLKDEPDIG